MATSDKVLTIKIRQKDFADKKECVFSRFLKYGKFEFQKDIHFRTQPGPVAKNATPRPLAGN